MKNAMIIDQKDNVIVAIEPIKKGEKAIYEINGQLDEVVAKDDIPIYHKLARTDIKKGENVIKYGEYIGEAGIDITTGTYVHTHNVVSVREKIVD